MPRSVTRINRNGVVYTSNVDRAQYTLRELTRAALRDIGKFITYRARGLVRSIAGRALRRSNRPRNAFQYWNRKREVDLVVGIKHDTWYGVDQELGINGQPKRDILRQTVLNNIDTIRDIQAKYLKHIEDEMEAERLIDENAEVADDDGDN
jgi:hypothetical protein